jgi:microcystin-dependent protein
MFITQEIGNGSTKEFSFSFKIPKGGLVNVYKTLAGNEPDETSDLLPTTDYNLVYTDVTTDFTDGKIVFNTAPANGDYITITPLSSGDTDIDFTAQNELSADNLNLALARHTTPINYSFSLYDERSVRYAINVKQDKVNTYNTLLPPLEDLAFWRRSGSKLISQDYSSFVAEVESAVSDSVKSQVNASATNTDISAALAGNAINTPINGSTYKVDDNFNVIVDKTISNEYSALAGATWAKDWATSTTQINDDYGNSGFSSKYYSDLSRLASTSTSGLIDELYVYDTTNTTTKVDLINHTSNEAWINVLENSFTVYIDGKMVQAPTAYSESGGATGGAYSYTVTIEDNPTVSNPSYITISPAVPASTQILVSRGEAQGDSTTMFITGSNFKEDAADSKIADRNLKNVQFTNDSTVAKKDLSNVTLANTYFAGGFGASTLTGNLDWNDVSNARSGNGETLLRGNAANGFGDNKLYFSFCFEYGTKNGSGNLTQLAIPYNHTDGIYLRSRYSSTWSAWAKMSSDEDLAPSLVPTGTIVDFAYGSYTTSHPGYLPCNGGAYSRTQYANLFSKIGTTYGAGDGSTTFNVPNLTGLFRRSFGGNSGLLGAKQGDAIRNITGDIISVAHGKSILMTSTGAFSITENISGGNAEGGGSTDKVTFDASKVVPTASENRPENMAFVSFIKY